MKKQICFLVLFLVLAAPCQEQIRLAVLEPEGKGLSKDEVWMLSLVQSSIAADFNKYSSITIIDRQNLEAIIAEQKRSLSAITSDKDAIAIGNLANASHILTGKITKTPKTFMLELAITDAETGKRQASYSPKGITPSQVEDLSALKAASADLLKQLGVSLTENQLEELRGPVANTQVQAQTALARGVVAERQGTSVAALSYFYQAAAFDPTLVEAVKRSSVMSANISSINIGDNIRNDIVWRKKWVEQLKETEETFYRIINSAPPPYTLYYSSAIETKNINYQKETADLSIALSLLANAEWFNAMQLALKAAQAVMDGLNATGRKSDWGLDEWPKRGVSETNPFALQRYDCGSFSCYSNKTYDISVEFELVNQQGRVIGRQTAKLKPSIDIYRNRDGNFIIRFTRLSVDETVTFNAVKANDISDNLTIRTASVNGAPPKTARFPIIAMSPDIIKRTIFTDSRDGKKYEAVEIGAQTWMAENLDFDAEGSFMCYNNDPSKCQKCGRYYSRNIAMNACPKGWHLPSIEEVNTLNYFVGIRELKAKNVWRNRYGNDTDAFGFAALPCGYTSKYRAGDGVSDNSDSNWWSTSEPWCFGVPYNASTGSSNGFRTGAVCSDYSNSVRCIKDD